MKRINWIVVTISLFANIIICNEVLHAQTRDFSFKHLSTVDGLSNFTVFSIAQDHQGFMWFGTMDGLNRYDGKNIKVYRHDPENPYPLGNNFVNALQVAGDSGIWVGTNKGLYYYNFHYDSFINVPLLSDTVTFANADIRTLLIDKEILWIGSDEGLFKYDLTDNGFVSYENSGIQLGIINAFKLSEDGILWIGHSFGLAFIKDSRIHNYASEEEGFELSNVISLETDHQKRLWVGTAGLERGLFILDLENDEKTMLSRQNKDLPHNRVNCMKSFGIDGMWVGTTWGLAVINEETLQSRHLHYQKHNSRSLSHNSIKHIFQADDEIIWLATYSGGVNSFNPGSQGITHISDKYGGDLSLSFNIVSSVFEDSSNKLWIGTEYGGVNILDKRINKIEVLRKNQADRKGLISNNIKSFVEDKYGRIFISTQFGVSIYDPIDKSYFNLSNQAGQRGRISHNIVHDLCKDKHGDIWIGTTGNNSHLQKYDIEKDTVLHYFTNNKQFPTLNSVVVNALHYDENTDIIWIGGNNGLASFNVSTSVYNTDDAFHSVAEHFQNTIINDVHVDQSGLLWIATFGSGLYVMDTKTYQLRLIGKSEGMMEISFYGICEDLKQNIWVSLKASLIKITNLEDVNDAISHEHFGIQEGFPPQQYFRNTACTGRDGTIYFGGDDGLVAFNPEEVTNILLNPKVAIVDVLVNGSSLKVVSSEPDNYYNIASMRDIALNHDQSSFAVHFIAPNYFNPDNTWYQYQLSDENSEWQDLGKSNSINFTKLKAGEYTLRLRASSDPASWDDAYTELKIAVLPPYWATPFAYFIYIVIILVMMYVFFVIARRWERLNHNLQIEHIEREKEHEFHEKRTRFFTDISHELRTPLTLILAPIEQLIKSNLGNAKIKNQLMLMLRNGERMLQLVNQLLDLRKLETGHMRLQVAKGDFSHFVKEVSLSFKEMSLNRNIKLNFISKPENIMLWFDRDKLEIVLFNLLSNALKFTPKGGTVTILIEKTIQVNGVQDNNIHLSLTNSGRGIPENELSNIFERFYSGSRSPSTKKMSGSGVGLEIVKKLVELHYGEIEVDSRFNDNGQDGITTFKISLKAGKAHFSEDQIIKEFISSESISNYKPVLDSTEESREQLAPTMNGNEAFEHSLLIVEDNEEVRSLVVRCFQDEYNLFEAGNGTDGMELANTNIPDLIISDIMMPEMDGIEFCKRIKDNVITSHIPVVLLTARTAVTFKYEGLETGADDYITKPFNIEDLKLRVKNLIRQRQLLKDKFTQDGSFSPADITFTSVDDKLMIKVRDYVGEYIGKENLTVEKLAEEVGMSRANFYRKIKALTNMSAAEFLRKLKFDHAAQLLKTNKFRVSEVQSIVGISDADYFRNCFKSQFGVTPKEYIDNHQN